MQYNEYIVHIVRLNLSVQFISVGSVYSVYNVYTLYIEECIHCEMAMNSFYSL